MSASISEKITECDLCDEIRRSSFLIRGYSLAILTWKEVDKVCILSGQHKKQWSEWVKPFAPMRAEFMNSTKRVQSVITRPCLKAINSKYEVAERMNHELLEQRGWCNTRPEDKVNGEYGQISDIY
ncbi:uncharacterized protein PHALS_10301 [Plasmopara halstedii]|uniref:Uncharacterized protein n=1 Tax=Plasmopara halstedii TaxID=4781 RepID=A0A0P1AG34_PLAHL|nr:uncharacterized protein PHALS_10301 [Plasmopara halstedii]CEG40081.1 hypothetical protein PHALS_10301 [Plasmopara halstedii]|eukprot:XP_024576450.1 hypothetical protein PHALS_10301 [Plasmopara halstedii]